MLISLFLLQFACTSEDSSFGNIPMEVDPSNQSPPPNESLDDTDTEDTQIEDTATIGSPCEGRTTGTTMGLCAENFSLQNKEGELVTLYEFYGDVIYLDLSAFT